MRCIQMLIREADDEQPDATRAIAPCDRPATDVATWHPETAPDQLEATTHTIGATIVRQTREAQWDVVDAALAEQYRQSFLPQPPHADGHAVVQVARTAVLTSVAGSVAGGGAAP